MKKKRRKYFGNLPKYRIFKLKPFIFLILSVFYFGQLFGQRDNPKITFNFQRAPFFKVIENIRQQIPYEFVFNSEDVRSLNNITLSLKEVTLQQALDALLEGSGMEYVIEQKTVVIKKKVNSVRKIKIDFIEGICYWSPETSITGSNGKIGRYDVGDFYQS